MTVPFHRLRNPLVLLTGLALLTAGPMLQAQAGTAPDAAQQRAAGTFSTRPQTALSRATTHAPVKAVALTPLTPRERVVQLLDRFTYGPRPGEVDRVLAQGADAWLTQQLAPDSLPDAVLARRLADYPTLAMSPAQLLSVFPDRAQVAAVADNKAPYPADPLQRAVFEVQVAKLVAERDKKKADGSASAQTPAPTDAEKAAQHKLDQAAASRLFGDLFALPKGQRMAALLQFSVPNRILVTGSLPGDQRALLLADFTPRERECFQAMAGQVSSSGNIGQELAQARILRDVLSERQVQAVMTNFWFNHFNVFLPKDADQWYTPGYERDTIRPHALGKFRDLLLATAQSPAMMVYLDNWLSIGPHSLANGVNPANPKSKQGNRGLNENYGREVMELHTLSVDGGYSQADVTSLSAILTGWGFAAGTPDAPAGPNYGSGFGFDYKRHEPGIKTWRGYAIDEDGHVSRTPVGVRTAETDAVATPESMKQGIAALDILAAAPQTAHFVSYLLAQYFVADVPPPALVDRLAATYKASDGDIKAILRTLVASPEFNARPYYRTKVKTPEEFVASAFRATATDPQNPGQLVQQLRNMGMPLYNALPPTGYYLTADQWMNTSALIDRLNFSYQLTNANLPNQRFDAPRLLATGLLATPGAMASASQSSGPEVALHVLEATMIGAPVSPLTNQLIEKQLAQQPAAATTNDTLALLTALVLGSPEFQLR